MQSAGAEIVNDSSPDSGGVNRWCVERSPWRNPQRAALLAAGLIVLATLAAYGNSFAGPFVFDDESSITSNVTIRQLWPIGRPLCPPNHGETVSGRPLLNLSLAINFAVSRLEVWSYHATNLAIHILAALALFGILRRTFLLPTLCDRWGAAAIPLALAIALLWAVHPLQTESVTYVIQRAESLVGLFYLLTLYCFVRGAGSSRAMLWYAGSVIACLLGMASKEVMVSAPLMVLLYDRTFVAGSFRQAWRRRYGLYLALAGTWLLLVLLVAWSGNRGKSSGFGTEVGCWEYLGTQFGAIVHYLKLCLWPHPLVFGHGEYIARKALEIVPCAVVVGLAGLATVVALWRWPKVGFLGAWFFAILAPTSSVVPELQTIAEHRMYLPLAAVVTGLVVGVCLAGRWLVRSGKVSSFSLRVFGCCLLLSAGVLLAILTFHRNFDYQSDLSIWQDTVAKEPYNTWAHINFGNALQRRGRIDEAIDQYQKALEIEPDFVAADFNLGVVLNNCGRFDEAVEHYKKVLDWASARNNRALADLVRAQISLHQSVAPAGKAP
jgi:tetratricopeptide (TPR) repeat protein